MARPGSRGYLNACRERMSSTLPPTLPPGTERHAMHNHGAPYACMRLKKVGGVRHSVDICFGGLLGTSWEVFGASWAPLGGSWEPPGHLLGGLWALLGASWGLLGSSWATLGGLWEPLGQSLGPLWDSLWNLWRHWGGLWGLLGAIWVPKRAQKGTQSEPNE